MPKPNLDTVPDDVLRHILEKCDFRRIQSLRKVCHSLRASIAYIKPNFHIQELEIHQFNSEVLHLTISTPDQSDLLIKYKKSKNGCKINGKLLENEDFLHIFFADFGMVLDHQTSILTNFKVEFHGEDIRFHEISETFLRARNQNSLLPVRNLHLEIHDQYHILSILPFISPEFINKILVCGQERFLNLYEVVKLEQWICAKEIDLLWVTVAVPVKEFAHFSMVNALNYVELTAEDVLEVKEAFFTSPTPKFFHFGYETFKDDPDLLVSAFGRRDLYTDDDDFEERGWWLKIPDKDEVILVELCNGYVEWTRKALEDVPERFLVKFL